MSKALIIFWFQILKFKSKVAKLVPEGFQSIDKILLLNPPL